MRKPEFGRVSRLALLTLTLCATACSNRMEDVRRLSAGGGDSPLVLDSLTLVYTERGKVAARVVAPELRSLENSENPYDEFPRGISVYAYNDSGRCTSMIHSNYALYNRRQRLWDARYNVVAVNQQGDSIRTEQIFWNEEAKRVYTTANVRVRSKGVILYGRGLESDDRFVDWVIKEPMGTISVTRKVPSDERQEK